MTSNKTTQEISNTMDVSFLRDKRITNTFNGTDFFDKEPKEMVELQKKNIEVVI